MRWVRTRQPAEHTAELYTASRDRVLASVGRDRFGWWAKWLDDFGAPVTSSGFDSEAAAKKHARRRVRHAR